MSLDFSKYYFYIAHGKHEKEVYYSLDSLRQKLPEKVRWTQEITSLKCGDILIGCLSNDEPCEQMTENLGRVVPVKPLMLIERKEIGDFCESKRSGHLDSQIARMRSFKEITGCDNHLVVEGFAEAAKKARSGKIGSWTVDGLKQAFTSIKCRDKFYVTHVKNFDEHAEFLQQCLKTYEKYKLYQEGGGPSIQKTYNKSLKLNNKGNMTPQLHWQDTLSRVPMVSMDMAEKIVEIYPSMLSLLKVVQEKDGVKALAEIKVGKNKLGPVKAKRIAEYLLA